jgi:hypothetical protein
VSTYNIKGGNQGAVGDGAHAENFTQNLLLTSELTSLSAELSKRANTPEELLAAKQVAEAEQAAKTGDEQSAVKKLKSAGAWALQVATELGTEVVTKIISSQLGL